MSYWNFKGVASQYVIKTYLHTKIMDYIQNISMKEKSQKSSSTRKISNKFFNNLYNSFLRLEFLIVSNKFPNWIQVDITKNFQISKELDHWTLSLEYFAIKSFSWSLNKGNNQGVLTWEMHGGPSTSSIVVLVWISKAHATTTLHKLQKYNPLGVVGKYHRVCIWSKLVYRAKWKDLWPSNTRQPNKKIRS